RDGTELHPNDAGFGTYIRAGKRGGEPINWNLRYEYSSPKLELNKTGYLQSQNRQRIEGNLFYVRTQFGPFLDYRARIGGAASWTTDGRGTPRGSGVSAETWATLPGYHFLGDAIVMDFNPYDVREISGTGVPFARRN